MKQPLLLLTMCLVGLTACDEAKKNPPQKAQTETKETAKKPEEKKTPPREEAKKEPPKKEESKKPALPTPRPGCTNITSLETAKTWAATASKPFASGDLKAFEKTMKCVDESFVAKKPTFQPEKNSGKVEVFSGQIDNDPEPELIIQARQQSAQEGAGERTQFFWIGFLDKKPNGAYTLAGSIQRPELYFCAQTSDKTGLKFGFTHKKHDPKAGLWVIEQETEACGTEVDVSYKKVVHQLKNNKINVIKLKAPKSMSWDRMEYYRQ